MAEFVRELLKVFLKKFSKYLLKSLIFLDKFYISDFLKKSVEDLPGESSEEFLGKFLRGVLEKKKCAGSSKAISVRVSLLICLKKFSKKKSGKIAVEFWQIFKMHS